MKKPLLTFAAAAALVTGCQTESQWGMTTQLEDMPANVQSAVRQEIGDAEIMDIDVERRTGNEVYEVTYNDGGVEQKLHVRNDGSVMSAEDASLAGFGSEEFDINAEAAGAERPHGSSASQAQIRGDAYGSRAETEVRGDVGHAQFNANTAEASADANVQLGTKLNDLPAAVRQTIQRQAPNAQIADIDKETRTGRTVYEISFREPGLNPKLHIAADGTMLNKAEASAVRADADFDTSSSYDADSDRIEAKRNVRGGAEALTEGPSAEANEPAGAEIEAEADLSNQGASIETRTETESLSVDSSNADVTFERADADYSVDADRIEAKSEVRGGAEALTEGPSAEASEPAGAEIEAEADLSNQGASIETRTETESLSADSSKADVSFEQQNIDASVSEPAGAELKADADLSSKSAEAEIDVDAEPAGANAGRAEVKFEDKTSSYNADHDRIEAKREVRGGAEALTQGRSAESHDLEAEASADVSHDSAGAERRFESEAAGAEAGTTQLRFNDLPQPVQNALRQHGGSADVSTIHKTSVYEVRFKDASKGTLKISADGTVMSGNK